MSTSDTPASRPDMRDNVVAFPERTPVEEDAARWVVRLDEGRLSEAERADFDAWRSASPAHADAFNRMRETWRDLDALAAISIGLSDPAPEPARARMARPLMWGGLGLAAASLVAAVVVGMGIPRAPADNLAPDFAAASGADSGVYQTARGGLQDIMLPDGSSITLNTASHIEVQFSDAERAIRLIEGEAFFDVAHDAARPFRVYARDGVASAVGTAFSVRLRETGVDVIVSDGKVSYAEAGETTSPVAFVIAGQTASFQDRVNIIETVELPEVERRLSWTEGRLIFAGEPLSQVVADISRYTDVRIEFADADVANLPVGGYFDVGEVDRLLDALETSFALDVERVDDRHVRILGPLP